jgi:broad specificity phosphatase PhoE
LRLICRQDPPWVRRYYWIRHGQAQNDAGAFRVSSFERDLRGEQDRGLSPLGRRQALLAAARARQLGVQSVLSSSLQRAHETADLISERARIPRGVALPELDEIVPGSLGAVERIVAHAIAGAPVPAPMRLRVGAFTSVALSVWQLVQWGRGLSGFESPGAARARIKRVLAMLDALPHERIAVVGHGYWITLMALTIPGGSRPRWVHNRSFSRVDADGAGNYRLVELARRIA